ncbi:tRNA (adenosine(37)-N6)-threonylcarbamoyltransferase complex dimerization subunit type 1 TsaB, partial [Bordetella pertussis]|uniref:tRNA (adenosine(37)-N6)-threonylcarbamoyltransferase complex dimerization subunit type 1 TsaB n=1 Tax=Bordetella pertussis TaxID=520 RepID=UPI00387936F1
MDLNLLAFETSSSRCGVALLTEHGAEPVVAVLEHEGAQEHAERLLPMARELLARAGLAPEALQAVAFGQGPGGFTGLRVACGVLPARRWRAVAGAAGAAADRRRRGGALDR